MWNTGDAVFDVKSRTADPDAATADNVKSAADAEPPSLFVTDFTNFNVGGLSVFVIVHVTF